MLTLEQIRDSLDDKNLAEVGRKTGVTRAYLAAIRGGLRVNPSYSVVKKLSDYLEAKANEPV
jgi:predicted transcriptional regulator